MRDALWPAHARQQMCAAYLVAGNGVLRQRGMLTRMFGTEGSAASPAIYLWLTWMVAHRCLDFQCVELISREKRLNLSENSWRGAVLTGEIAGNVESIS